MTPEREAEIQSLMDRYFTHPEEGGDYLSAEEWHRMADGMKETIDSLRERLQQAEKERDEIKRHHEHEREKCVDDLVVKWREMKDERDTANEKLSHLLFRLTDGQFSKVSYSVDDMERFVSDCFAANYERLQP